MPFLVTTFEVSMPIKRLYATSYVWITVNYFLSCTVSEMWRIIGPICAVNTWMPVYI